MRKLVFLFFLSFSISFSQEIVNKNGFPILPETGDWSIGTDAGSFIGFFGNIFSGDYNPVDISFHEGAFIYIKSVFFYLVCLVCLQCHALKFSRGFHSRVSENN